MNKFKFVAEEFKPLRPQWLMACSKCIKKWSLREKEFSVHMLFDPDAPGCMICGEKDGLCEVLATHKNIMKIYG